MSVERPKVALPRRSSKIASIGAHDLTLGLSSATCSIKPDIASCVGMYAVCNDSTQRVKLCGNAQNTSRNPRLYQKALRIPSFQASGSSPNLFTRSRAMSHMASQAWSAPQPEKHVTEMDPAYRNPISLLLSEIATHDPSPHVLDNEVPTSAADKCPVLLSVRGSSVTWKRRGRGKWRTGQSGPNLHISQPWKCLLILLIQIPQPLRFLLLPTNLQLSLFALAQLAFDFLLTQTWMRG